MLPFLASSGWYHKGILTGYMRDANLFPATMETFSVGLAYKLIETTISSITQVKNSKKYKLFKINITYIKRVHHSIYGKYRPLKTT